MPPDPDRVAETRVRLQRAVADPRSADVLIGSVPPHPDTALYHCQQAAEKCWKAFLFWHDVAFRKTHDLRELGRACVRLDLSLDALADRAEDLTPIASLFRYSGALQVPTRAGAADALILVRDVYAAVRSRLPPEVSP